MRDLTIHYSPFTTHFFRTALSPIAVCLLALTAGTALAAPTLAPTEHPGLQYALEKRAAPRPLQIHYLAVDLRDPSVEIAALVADDPDGAGPAEARLEKPEKLAGRRGVLAAVNANAFTELPPPAGAKAKRNGWYPDRPVNILSWAQADARVASEPERHYLCFWVDAAGNPQMGNLAQRPAARCAAAGFGALLHDGRILPGPGGALHPRTAVGLDPVLRRLWFVVVDGRRRGVSEGVSVRELAALLRDCGCTRAINLDGGGSSVMLLRQKGRSLEVMNRPSAGTTRPVPVMLGIRRCPDTAKEGTQDGNP